MKSKFKVGDTFIQGELTYKVTGFDAQGRAISAVCTTEDTIEAVEETQEQVEEKVEETIEETTAELPVSEEKEGTVEKTATRKRR